MTVRHLWKGAVVVAVLMTAACSDAPTSLESLPDRTLTPDPAPTELLRRFFVQPRPPGPAVLVGAGDIAGCPPNYQDEATAALLRNIAGTVFTAGDNAYMSGTPIEFAT